MPGRRRRPAERRPLLSLPAPADDDPAARDGAAEPGLRVGEPKTEAAGLDGVTAALKASIAQQGAPRTLRTLRKVNQPDGFDCPGCAWPEGERPHLAEFCENGAKAVAEEATTRRVRREFFAEHSVADLAERSDWWLGQQGRLTEPMVKRQGSSHYEPITWDAAFALIADELCALDTPDQAVFYTSGRTSNEAAFLYQLLVRSFGTNNLPDCSNMCHESSGVALGQTIGVGKGSVRLADFPLADLIIIAGQNPGTNHPRMLTALEHAKRAGASIVAVNPLPEAGLLRFQNPQTARGLLGSGTQLADGWLQIRLGGDQALFQALGRLLIAGGAVDREFIAEHTTGFDAYAAHLSEPVTEAAWDGVTAATGLARAQIEGLASRVAEARSVIVCWAMGLTQHPHAVATIRDIVNVLLLGGHLGRPGAGLCPVRGHSNVQGDRTMGIKTSMPEPFLAALEAEFGLAVPRQRGLDTVEAIKAMADGAAAVFIGLGGNFVRASPDTTATAAALRRCRLTVQISTKLNGSHAACGEVALILPTLGRTERDLTASGEQVVTVEDSMGQVHASRGRREPAAPGLRSEAAIICGLAEALFGQSHPVDWAAFAEDYRLVRAAIARVVPGFDGYEEKIAQPGGFTLPHAPRDERRFPTASGRAEFTVNELVVPQAPPGRLLLQTIRSHDQFNTTIYGLDDRYRGVRGGRRVVFVNPDDLAELGIPDGSLVDLVSEWLPGAGSGSGSASAVAAAARAPAEERRASGFRVVGYPTARGCAAAYFPETNVLVPLDSVAAESNTPTSKLIVVRLEPAHGG